MKYYFIKYKFRSGEDEFNHVKVVSLENDQDFDQFVKEDLASFYGDGAEEIGYLQFEYRLGEVTGEIDEYRHLTSECYNVLKEFI